MVLLLEISQAQICWSYTPNTTFTTTYSPNNSRHCITHYSQQVSVNNSSPVRFLCCAGSASSAHVTQPSNCQSKLASELVAESGLSQSKKISQHRQNDWLKLNYTPTKLSNHLIYTTCASSGVIA